MRRFQSTISGKHVFQLVGSILVSSFETFAKVGAHGGVTTLLLVELLVRAAAERRSLNAICKSARNALSGESVRKALMSGLPSTTAGLEPMVVEALNHRLPKSLARRLRTMAIDFHNKPYYGDKKTPGAYRGQPKASTKTFFAYATLLVIQKGRTYTVGLCPVVNDDDISLVIQRLLEQAAAKGLKPSRLLLDRGFYAAKVMLDLQQRGIPFVIPMIRRGKKGATKEECTGTNQFFVKGGHGWTTYTWEARIRNKGRKGPRQLVTIDVCIMSRGQNSVPWVFACHGVTPLTPDEIAALYRRRFRIETSYRQMREGLAMTCSKNPVYRLLLVLIAFVLRNVWLWLHGTVFATRDERGALTLQLHLMRARQMLYMIIRYLDHRLAMLQCILVPNPPPKAA